MKCIQYKQCVVPGGGHGAESAVPSTSVAMGAPFVQLWVPLASYSLGSWHFYILGFGVSK